MESAELKASLPVEAAADPKLVHAVLLNRQRFERAITSLEVVVDLVTVTLSVLFSYWFYQAFHIGKTVRYAPGQLIPAAVAFAVLFVALLDRDGSYAPASSLLGIRETERVLRVSSIAFSLVFVVTFLSAYPLSRAVLVGAVVVAPLAIAGVKQLMYQLVRTLHAQGYGIQNVIVYGAGTTARRIFSALVHSPKLGLRPIAIVDDDEQLAGMPVYESGYRRNHCLTVTPGPVTQDLIHRFRANLLLIGIPSIDCKHRDRVAEKAFAEGCAVAFVPQLSCKSEMVNGPVDIDGILVSSLAPPASRSFYEFGKRAFDCAASLLLIGVSLPIWGAIALAIRLDSPRPARRKASR
jgi:FlaA1/EpsC-like NDP-sugar epimerase